MRVGPYRFFFYANDRTEPIHVHIEREAYKAKFWVAPVRLAVNGGFRPAEIRSVHRIVREHERLIGKGSVTCACSAQAGWHGRLARPCSPNCATAGQAGRATFRMQSGRT